MRVALFSTLAACAMLCHAPLVSAVRVTRSLDTNDNTTPVIEPRGTTSSNVLLKNVNVFDGEKLVGPTDIWIVNGVIGKTDKIKKKDVVTEVDASGQYLLPGLIDCHMHISSNGTQTLLSLLNYGVTTGLDMASWPSSKFKAVRNVPGYPQIRSAGVPGTVSGSAHSHIPNLPAEAILTSADDLKDFVKARIDDGSDFIKMIADVPGPSQDMLDQAVVWATNKQMVSIIHAAGTTPFQMGIASKATILTHVPLDKPLSQEDALQFVANKQVNVPTLTMMRGVASNRGFPYTSAVVSVSRLNQASATILVGTDGNEEPGTPANIKLGSSVHEELELLVVKAGLSTLQVLQGATSLAASTFGLTDRGRIQPGLRADLVLLNSNPLVDIKATRDIQKVWVGGVEFEPAASTKTVYQPLL